MSVFQMDCSIDSGLVIVVFITLVLLWVVGMLLFYDFEDVCHKYNPITNISMVRFNLWKRLFAGTLYIVGGVRKRGCWLGSPGPIKLIASRRLAIPAPPAQERSS